MLEAYKYLMQSHFKYRVLCKCGTWGYWPNVWGVSYEYYIEATLQYGIQRSHYHWHDYDFSEIFERDAPWILKCVRRRRHDSHIQLFFTKDFGWHELCSTYLTGDIYLVFIGAAFRCLSVLGNSSKI